MSARNSWMWHLMRWGEGANVIQRTTTGDVKASAGIVYAVHVEMDGVTAGDKVEVRDNSTVRKTFMADGTDHHFDWAIGLPGAAFATDINIVVTKTGGAVYVTVVYL
ncbi:MAG: hypothetical protein KAY24_00095 [Candidatus Eisenbacteria sp.]|nr:hypothetical protein [Candidatus Eisenbacteria bacterium]